jgi:hypothetical protein
MISYFMPFFNDFIKTEDRQNSLLDQMDEEGKFTPPTP